jgi:hypothetical protein
MPGIIVTRAGQARTIYYPHRLGLHYNRLGHPDYAELYLRPLRAYAPEPPAGSDAPETVQAEYYAGKDRLAAHLVNLTFNERILTAPLGPSKQSLPPFMPQYSVHPARIVVPVGPFKVWFATDWERVEAYDAVTGERLRAEVSGGRVAVEVPRLGEYAVVVVQPRG